MKEIKLFFTDVFGVSESTLEKYGAFNVSLLTDLPLFIDPFLLFNSKKPEYRKLHDSIIGYLRFLKDAAISGKVSSGLLKSWYHFPEVKQNWLGFCVSGNAGRGLGSRFANALNRNMNKIFSDFGNEQITNSSHLEKLCLIDSGVGRDMISDFTTNLIKDYLLTYTESFAKKYLDPEQCKSVAVNKALFNYNTETWTPKTYHLPWFQGDYVILTPKDLLTRDDTWISRRDMLNGFESIPFAIENEVLREQINRYFKQVIPRKPKKLDYDKAKEATLRQFPDLIDYFIKYKEDHGEEAVVRSSAEVQESHALYIKQFGELPQLLAFHTQFYQIKETTAEETLKRIEFFKDVIENKGGHKIFYVDGKPVHKETDIHILFRLVWYGTSSDVSREVNDGRGPADFKLSKGASDKTLVEFKLASNSKLEKNLQKQLPIYQKASDALTGYKVIIFFTEAECRKVLNILNNLKLSNDPSIILVDARNDNKPTGSRA